jgi:hypothetical protein
MTFILAAEVPEVQLPTPLIDDILISRDFLLASESDKLSIFKSKLQLDRSAIEHIAELTAGQRENPLWGKIRHKRLTASHFSRVLAAINRNSFPPSLFKDLAGNL